MLIVLPVIILAAAAVTVLLLTIDVTGDTAARIELVRTGLTVGAGTGGVVALVLAGRRQWSAEQAAQSSEYDATERRITELYIKGVEQLGSEKAPVRLAGLYALERLAESNPRHRQSIVNVICAYLRMPYFPPEEFLSPEEFRKRRSKTEIVDPHPQQVSLEDKGVREELLVRSAAQRILADHLGAHDYGPGGPREPAAHWGEISIDLRGAILVDFNLSNATVYEASFYQTRFLQGVSFNNTKFARVTNFAIASFGWLGCTFRGAVFLDDVYFGDTAFVPDRANFENAQFHGDIRFGGVRTLPKKINLNGVQVYNLNARIELPEGWSVRADNKRSIGSLVQDGGKTVDADR